MCNSIEHSLRSEYNSRSSSQEIPRALWNLKFHRRVHKNRLFSVYLTKAKVKEHDLIPELYRQQQTSQI